MELILLNKKVQSKARLEQIKPRKMWKSKLQLKNLFYFLCRFKVRKLKIQIAPNFLNFILLRLSLI